MVDRSDVVLAVIPVLALSGSAVASAARLLESAVGVGRGVAQLPLTPVGLIASLLAVVGALFVLPGRS